MSSAKKLVKIFYFICDVNTTSFNLSAAQCTCPSCTWHNIELLWCTTADFVAPDMWPPNSLDLNLADYAIWSVIQQRVYETGVHDIGELRQHLLHVWCSLEQSLIDDAVDQCPTPLHACVHARGGHFEQTVWLSICFPCTWWTSCFTPCFMLLLAGVWVRANEKQRSVPPYRPVWLGKDFNKQETHEQVRDPNTTSHYFATLLHLMPAMEGSPKTISV